jgi:hypothetical protein
MSIHPHSTPASRLARTPQHALARWCTRLVATAALLGSVSTVALAQDGEDTPWWDRAEEGGNATVREIDTSALGDGGNRLPTETWAERFASAGHEFYFSIRILGAEAGRAAFTIGGPVELDGVGTVIPLQGMAVSVGFFAAVYPFENSALTYVNPANGLPFWSEKIIDESDAHRRYAVTYDQPNFLSSVVRERDDRSSEFTRMGPSDLHDALSFIIDVRSRSFDIGSRYVYHVFDGWKLSRLTLEVVAHRRMYTPVGNYDAAEFRIWREVLTAHAALPWANDSADLPPVYMTIDGPNDVGVGWFSNDELRIPLGLSITAPIGSMELRLDRMSVPGN